MSKTTKAIVGIVAAVIAGAFGVSTTQKDSDIFQQITTILIPHHKLLK